MLKVNKMEKASLTCFNARTNKRILTHASSAWLSVRVLPSPHGKRHFQLRRMAQFSATPQIGFFHASFSGGKWLHLQHGSQQKLNRPAADGKTCGNGRKTEGIGSVVPPSCLPSASLLPPFCLPSASHRSLVNMLKICDNNISGMEWERRSREKSTNTKVKWCK